jgi:4-amino-4-deoxy-L-arabinose transferase-like glycosyltransferase
MSRRQRALRRASDSVPLPKHPFRDSAIVYGVLAGVIVAVAYLTKGDVVDALVVGAGFFVLATAWSWWRFRQRLEAQQGRQ